MNKVYTRINWVNLPSRDTALDEINLNKMDSAINTLDDRIISLDTTKADTTALNNLVSSWTMNETTGVITITKVDGTQTIFDLNIEKIPVSFSMDANGVITMTTSDGTRWTANISDMIPILQFNDSDEIAVSVSGSGKDKTYSFSVKVGAIKEKHLDPNYLAEIKTQVANAQAYSENALQSANNADYDAKLAQSYAIGGSNVRDGEDTDNAKYYSEQANNFATSASQSATTAINKANEASVSASSASISENNAKTSETNAKTSEDNASSSASSASQSATTATIKANEASSSATNAKTSEDNAKASENNASDYESGAESWYNQAQQIAEGLKGGLLPMGTITFAELPTTSTAGYMYNISNEFTTDSRFKEGAGITVSAGSNVYYTNDGYWDVMAGSPVTGVKGNNETTYRRGNVNITKDNIGLGNVGNYKAVSTVASQGLSDAEKSNARANIGAGTSNFSGSYTDLSNKPTIPTVNNGTLTIQKNGTNVQTFTSNQSTNATANVTVPTKVSELTNDSGFTTNTGTITGIKMNGSSKGTSGVVDLGTVITSHQDISGKLGTSGDSKSCTVTYTTGDATDANVTITTGWTSVSRLTSGLTHANLFNRISTMMKNVRWLYKLIGTTDISSIGDGTIRGAINSLNSDLGISYYEKSYTSTSSFGSKSFGIQFNVLSLNGHKFCIASFRTSPSTALTPWTSYTLLNNNTIEESLRPVRETIAMIPTDTHGFLQVTMTTNGGIKIDTASGCSSSFGGTVCYQIS